MPPYEVLVVDDNLAAAVEYARLIALTAGVEATATDSPEDAIALIQREPIKVAVLDQRMPTRGTDLFRRLKTVEERLKVLMLSGEASTQELDDAYKLGYDDYLHKSRIAEVGTRVQTLYAKYQVDSLQLNQKAVSAPLLTHKRGPWPFRTRVDYVIETISTLNEKYVFVDSWKTVKQINAGETVKENDRIEIERRFVIETSHEERVASELSAEAGTLAKLKSKMEQTIATKFSANTYEASKRQIEVSREYRLPEAPVNPGDLHVASRHYQRAPVYRQLRITILKRCQCCNSEQTIPIIVYQLTSRVATRHVDYFSDGTEKLIATGIH